LPQQLPGPAQLAWPGEEPQQAVSPEPGILPLASPDKDEGAESIFLTFPLPQDMHLTFSFIEATRISLTFPQSEHKKSNKGI
jgi:hypothetical protein